MSAKKPIEEKISHIAPFGLRMLPDLREKIAASAEASGRSLNAEIVHRLEYSFMIRFPLEETRSPQVRIAEYAAKIIELSQRVVDEGRLVLLEEEKRYLRFLGATSQISQADILRRRHAELHDDQTEADDQPHKDKT